MKPKLLFVVTEDWYFCSHRLPLAVEAIAAGFDVSIATRVNRHGDMIASAGIQIHPWNISRGSTKLFGEIAAWYELFKIFREVKPDLVHQVALKPVLYGSLIAKLVGPQRVVNALGGMGFVFTGGAKRARWLRTMIVTGFKWVLRGRRKILILQNPDDMALIMHEAGLDRENVRLIRGAGVDIQRFAFSSESNDVPLIVLPARMLWDKGVGEFVEAARILKSEGVEARFVLAGGMDHNNPAGIAENQLEDWVQEGVVEWIGHREDMPEIFQQSHIVCLPSYREGLPKALLEAAACGRAIVATDVPGCREIIQNEINGLLVAARNSEALAAALKNLILDPGLRAQMGTVGRKLVEDEFSDQIVIRKTLAVYKELLGRTD